MLSILCSVAFLGCAANRPSQAASSQTFYLDNSGEIRAGQPTTQRVPSTAIPPSKPKIAGSPFSSFWDWFTDMDAFDRNIGRAAALQSIMASQATIQNSIRSNFPRTYTITPQPFGTYQVTGGY